jgi:hypothetical protein
MSHMTEISMTALHYLFAQRVVSNFCDVPWPPYSLDLTAPNIFL